MFRYLHRLLTGTPHWIRTAVWLTCLAGAFTATHIPPPSKPLPFTPNDKLLHFVGFAGLGLLTAWQAASGRSAPASRKVAAWFLALIAYGALDELSQPIAGRSCELGDWLADCGGAAVGIIALTLYFLRSAPAENEQP